MAGKILAIEIIRDISSHWRLRHRLMASSAIALGLVSATAIPVRAATDFWTGSNSTDWFDAGNWSAGLPTNATSTRIDTVAPNATVIGAPGAQSTGLRVGVSGTGALTINNGGTVNNTLGIIGDQLGSTGTATVDGVGSAWINSQDFYVGSGGNGTLTVSNGGTVSMVHGFIGNFAGATGAVTVDGAGSTWTNSGDLQVSIFGNGTLTISNGGKVSNNVGYIAQYGATGAVTVDGAGSTWTNSNDLSVGGAYDVGNGTLTIRNGGAVSVGGNSHLGDSAGATGTASVDGVGSSWITNGDLSVGNGGTGTLTISNGGAVSNGYAFIAANPGSTGAATVDGIGSTWTNNGDLRVGDVGTGTLTISNGGTVINNSGLLGGSVGSIGTATVDGIGSTWTTNNTLFLGRTGTGSLTISNGGTVSVPTLFIAPNAGSDGTLNIGAAAGQAAVAAGTLNATTVKLGHGNSQIVFNHTSANYIFDPTITSVGAGTGGVDVEAGTTTLTAISTYIRPTIIDGGTLLVSGSIANSAVTVNAGGTLGGSGTVGSTSINGGTLAPGNASGALSVNGNLSFTGASSYNVGFSASGNDRTNVTGTAALGGASVNASFAPGAYITKQYTILNATGGLGGTTFGSLNTNLASSFMPTLSYDADNAYLDLTLQFVGAPGAGLNQNQTNVANGLTGYFNRTGGIPLAYAALGPAGLTQASGEIATATQQTTFDAMTQFMGLMSDPFTAYQGLDTPGSLHFWAAGFGGSQTTTGDAVIGSNDATSSIFSTAVGADYRLSPNTVAGFALAGGSTNFSVNGLGAGRSDLYQVGAHLRHTEGPAYISATLADGWQDITTNRTVTISGTDQLQAQFNANAFSGRVEGGYRLAAPIIGGIGITPYTAGQFTRLDLPAYAEQVLAGTNTFALAYGAQSVSDTRSEFGLRSDKSFMFGDATLTLGGRAAWAHDFNTDRSATATFQALSGASFTVNGATQAQDSVLTTASAEMKWLSGWSTAASFEGEFSSASSSYAGKGVMRYTW